MKIVERINTAWLKLFGGVPAQQLETERSRLVGEIMSLERYNAFEQREYHSVRDTLGHVAQELEEVSNQYQVLKKTFARLITSKPVLVVLPRDAALISGDYYVKDGVLTRIDNGLVGQLAGAFGVYVRSL